MLLLMLLANPRNIRGFPDGSREAEEPQHNCGRPRLKVVVSYADNSDRASRINNLQAARDALVQTSARFPGVSLEHLRERTAAFFGVAEADLF